MDSGPFLGDGPSTRPTNFDNKQQHTAPRKTTMDADGGRRDRIGIRTSLVGARGPGNQLGQIRGREECPVYKNGARTKSGRYRAKQLGPGKCRQGNGKTKQFATDLQLLMTETTNYPNLLKTLVFLERQQHDNIPEEYSIYKKKLSSRYGLVFHEDKIIVPKNLRTTIISLSHKGHPAINKMSMEARHFWWPRITEAIQNKCDNCVPCKMAGKSIKPNIPSTKKNQLPLLNKPNEEIQLDFIGTITVKNRRFYILFSMDRFSK